MARQGLFDLMIVLQVHQVVYEIVIYGRVSFFMKAQDGCQSGKKVIVLNVGLAGFFAFNVFRHVPAP